jgi:hypothetical protein
MPGSRQLEDYAAEAQPVISTFFSRFHVLPQALMAADLAAHPVHTQNQLSQVAQEQRAIDFWRDAEWDLFVEPGQTPLDPLIDHRARKQSLSTLVASFLTATPTSMSSLKSSELSLHLRLRYMMTQSCLSTAGNATRRWIQLVTMQI